MDSLKSVITGWMKNVGEEAKSGVTALTEQIPTNPSAILQSVTEGNVVAPMVGIGGLLVSGTIGLPVAAASAAGVVAASTAKSAYDSITSSADPAEVATDFHIDEKEINQQAQRSSLGLTSTVDIPISETASNPSRDSKVDFSQGTSLVNMTQQAPQNQPSLDTSRSMAQPSQSNGPPSRVKPLFEDTDDDEDDDAADPNDDNEDYEETKFKYSFPDDFYDSEDFKTASDMPDEHNDYNYSKFYEIEKAFRNLERAGYARSNDIGMALNLYGKKLPFPEYKKLVDDIIHDAYDDDDDLMSLLFPSKNKNESNVDRDEPYNSESNQPRGPLNNYKNLYPYAEQPQAGESGASFKLHSLDLWRVTSAQPPLPPPITLRDLQSMSTGFNLRSTSLMDLNTSNKRFRYK